MEKLLSVVVPCYNSQAYMKHAVDSLLAGGEALEILIVDDGSVDDTARIADEYERRFPGVVRAFHQPNGGHGDAVMTGLKNASGLYFKVVDSDDWVDENALCLVMKTLGMLSAPQTCVDLVVCNYVYDKEGQKHRHVVRYANALPENRVFSWREAGRLRPGQYILMHSAIYRTALLRSCGLSLPKHTYYVDNLYVYEPMPNVKAIYYLNVDLYHYQIGRADQSVQEENMIKRIDEQLRVNLLMARAVDLKNIQDLRMRAYLLGYLGIVTTVSSVMLEKSGTEENLKKKKELWAKIKCVAPDNYALLRRRPMGVAVHLPGRLGRRLVLGAYRISRKIYGFN